MRTELKVVLVSGICALVGSFSGSIASYFAARVQLESEITKAKIAAVASEREMFLTKSELLFSQLSEVLSFFDANDQFEIEEAKAVFARARKASFELAVYAPPEVAMRAVQAVEAVNAAAGGSNPKELAIALQSMQLAFKEMITVFYRERFELDAKRAKILE
jgi:hypothetical protein